ncbi:MAG: SDR family oxidoreductase [Dehalococcoidales bacterium]|nr:SDR family oxidoreductase [Dehalococcoidales bacterium]
MDRVKDKLAIVTGGGSGIGEATSKLLAAEGAAVAIADRDDIGGERVAGEITAAGGQAVFRHLDVSIEKDVEKVISEIFTKYGKLNILVNCAGIVGSDSPPHEITEEQFDEVMAVNLKGPFYTSKYAIPCFRKSGGGSVINVSSIMGMLAGPTMVYNTSKSGLRHMTKNDAYIYAKENIRFNSVHPGYIITPLFRKLAEEKNSFDESVENESNLIPVGRMGMPEDIAYGILYLASDESSYVTGSELIIDGGCMIV